MPIAWVIKWDDHWLDFDPYRTKKSWPCTEMGDARFFSHPKVAEQFVQMFCDDKPGCEVREVQCVVEGTD